MPTKKEREQIQKKYGGKCAYCGCELEKGWHVDEIMPVRRNGDGTCLHPERFHIDNQNPACPSCNINKHANSIEGFRGLISGFIKSLNRDSTQYKIAKRYGMIQETELPVLFYFEQIVIEPIEPIAL